MDTGLPTGTVTFLFTDIEGSTQLLQSLGEGYDVVLSTHHAILREAFAAHGGTEVGTEGDSFFVVFAGARAGIDAAVAAQRGLAAHEFPNGVKVRVRMGIHTGEGRLVDGNYRGIDVHRAARIAAAGHGGQILVSETTRALVEGSPGEDLGFTDLGEHRLKDLEHPDRLFQLTAPGLLSSFPPPRSVDSRPNNLTAPATSFIGREQELQDIRKQLNDNRLVTLTGPGGTGKSRLAIQIAYELLPKFDDGVFLVPLASVTDPALLASTVAQVLGLRQQGTTSIESTVKQHLASKSTLLILDNFEHLLSAAFFVSDLLAETSRLTVLVTSRAPLRIVAEQEYPIPPMSLPAQDRATDLIALETSEAVRLFIQRARAVRPDFALTERNAGEIVEICRRLDGLPLALELAAARIRTLEPHEVARRLNRSLSFLTGGPRDLPARQQTLRNAIAWSYDLLDEQMRELFARLGVFSGGFSLEAVEAVCCDEALDLLEMLAEQSIVKATLDQFGARYVMLGPVKEYALERLEESGQAATTREKHARYFYRLALEAGRNLQGKTQVEWLGRLELEKDNLRAAMAWALDSGDDEVAAGMGWSLWMFWWLHGHQQEGRRAMEALLRHNPADPQRSMALAIAGSTTLVQGDHTTANRYFRECIELARAIGDKPRLSFCLSSLGLSSLNLSDWDTAVACFEEALPLFREEGNQMMVSGAWTNLGNADYMQGNLEAAEAHAREGLQVARRIGDPVSTYFALYTLSQVALARNDPAGAAPYLREGLTMVGEVGNPARLTYYLETYALVIAAGGDLERAARVIGASEAVRKAGGVPRYIYLAAPGDLYERTLEKLRSGLGERNFETARTAGREMTAQQAVAYALDGRSVEAALAGSPFGLVETEPEEVGAPDKRSAPEAADLRPTGVVAAPDRPLVGRRAEMLTLRTALAAAERGKGGALLVFGEPGIGKTRLVEELAGVAVKEDFTVAGGGAVEGGSTPAHWPWVQVITSLLEATDPPGLKEAVGAGAPELAQIVPELKEVIGGVDAPASTDAETARLHLFEAVSGLLAELGRRKPILVVLEDLQWADIASLQLLGFLAPHLKQNRLLVVGTYRPAEVGNEHPLAETMSVLARHQVVERVELRGLPETEVGELIAGYTGEPPEPGLVATVQSRTEGNPFFVTELARLLASDSSLGAEGAGAAIPSGVRDVVRRRLGRLPAETNAVLSTAAVMGRDFELRVISAAFKLDADGMLGLVESACAGGLVAEHPTLPGYFRFNHDLVRETILEGLTAARRSMLHARVGEAIESVYGDTGRAIEIAYHFSEAAPAIGPARAVPHVLRAAEAAVASLAYEQAGEQLSRALQLIDLLPAGADRDHQELQALMRLNTLAIMTKGYAAPELADNLERARALGNRLGEVRALIPVRWGLVSFHNNDGNTLVARRLAEDLLKDVTPGGVPAELVPAHLGVGIISMFQGELEKARHHFDEALLLNDGLTDPWLLSWMHQDPIVSCSTFQVWCLTVLGESELAGSYADDAVGRASGQGNEFDTAHALYFASARPVFERRIPEARRAAREAVEFARDRGFHAYVALGSIFHGWASALEGDAEAGVEEIKQTLNAMAGRARIDHSIFLALLAEAHLLAGQPSLGLAVADRGLDVMPKTGERFYEAEIHRVRGEILLASGNREEGIEALNTALATARARGARLLEARAAAGIERHRE